MSYEPTTWKSGDTVTSAKLNKMEQGIANAGVLIVHDTDGTLDKTWAEITEAGFAVCLSEAAEGADVKILMAWIADDHGYAVMFYGGQSLAQSIYVTETENGYPATQSGGGGAIGD